MVFERLPQKYVTRNVSNFISTATELDYRDYIGKIFKQI